MKRKILVLSMAACFMLTGCGTNGMNLSNGQVVTAEFSQGKIVDIKKVLVQKSMMQTLTGAGIGAGAGALLGSRSSSKNAVKGAAIGAGVGAIAGYATGMLANNNEGEAYQTSVVDGTSGKVYTVYLETPLKVGQTLEYVKRDNEITNVNLVR